jgi:hypothetical protein
VEHILSNLNWFPSRIEGMHKFALVQLLSLFLFGALSYGGDGKIHRWKRKAVIHGQNTGKGVKEQSNQEHYG